MRRLGAGRAAASLLTASLLTAALLAASLLVGATGCLVNSPAPGDEPNTTPAADALQDPAHPGVEACAGGMGPAELGDHLELAAAFRDSLEEAVTCGQLAMDFRAALVFALVSAAASTDAHPTGVEYAGDGMYRVGDVMMISLHLGTATSFGAPGERLRFDLFDPASYFATFEIGVTAGIDLTGATYSTLTIDFEGSGPAIELLGLGPAPASPITIDTRQLEAALGSISLSSDIVVERAVADSTVRWVVASPGTTFAALGDTSQGLGMELVEASAVRGSTGQTLRVLDWDLRYTAGHGGTTDGTARIAVEGGAFPFEALLSYPHRRAPDVSLRCL